MTVAKVAMITRWHRDDDIFRVPATAEHQCKSNRTLYSQLDCRFDKYVVARAYLENVSSILCSQACIHALENKYASGVRDADAHHS